MAGAGGVLADPPVRALAPPAGPEDPGRTRAHARARPGRVPLHLLSALEFAVAFAARAVEAAQIDVGAPEQPALALVLGHRSDRLAAHAAPPGGLRGEGVAAADTDRGRGAGHAIALPQVALRLGRAKPGELQVEGAV